jgi:thymidylate kinase
MDGPNINRAVDSSRMNRLVKFLLKTEENYYNQIMPPDLLIVLRLDPEIAVRRKTDESEAHVRTRSSELWETDWRGTRAHVIDAGQSREDVRAQIQEVVWENL